MVRPIFRLRDEGGAEAISPRDPEAIDHTRTGPERERLESESFGSEAVNDITQPESDDS